MDSFFFFFQAEDGIRDLTVTGVQTCALPISVRASGRASRTLAHGVPDSVSPVRRRVPLTTGGPALRRRGAFWHFSPKIGSPPGLRTRCGDTSVNSSGRGGILWTAHRDE